MSLYRQLNHVAWILRIRPSADRLLLTIAVPRVRVGVPMASRVRFGPDPVEYQFANPPSALGDQMSMPWRAGARDELVSQLNKTRALPHWPLALVGAVVLGSITPWLAQVGLPVLVWLAWRDKVRRTVVLFYEFDEPVRSAYESLRWSFDFAERAERAYAMKTQSSPRRPLTRNTSGPAHLTANVRPPTLISPSLSVFLLPDLVLVREHGRYRVVGYEDLTIGLREETVTESGSRPRDAVQPNPWPRHDDVTHERPAANEVQYGRLSLAGSARFEIVWLFSHEHAHVQLAKGIEEMRDCWISRAGGRRGP
jgi:hypothetical protein